MICFYRNHKEILYLRGFIFHLFIINSTIGFRCKKKLKQTGKEQEQFTCAEHFAPFSFQEVIVMRPFMFVLIKT